MNPHYSAFVELGKTLAADRSLQWEFPLNADGSRGRWRRMESHRGSQGNIPAKLLFTRLLA